MNLINEKGKRKKNECTQFNSRLLFGLKWYQIPVYFCLMLKRCIARMSVSSHVSRPGLDLLSQDVEYSVEYSGLSVCDLWESCCLAQEVHGLPYLHPSSDCTVGPCRDGLEDRKYVPMCAPNSLEGSSNIKCISECLNFSPLLYI